MSADTNQEKPTETSKTRLRLWLALLKTSRAIEADIREKFRLEFNTTLPRFDVMAALSRNKDGLRMSELSKDLKVSNGNVTGIVDRLVEENIIVRVAVAGDRRASRVRLTAKGEKTFQQQAKAHEGWINEMLEEFSGDDAELLLASLSKAFNSKNATKE